MPKTGRSVPTPANDHKSLSGMDIASGIAENPRPSKTVPKESRPLRFFVVAATNRAARSACAAGGAAWLTTRLAPGETNVTLPHCFVRFGLQGASFLRRSGRPTGVLPGKRVEHGDGLRQWSKATHPDRRSIGISTSPASSGRASSARSWPVRTPGSTRFRPRSRGG